VYLELALVCAPYQHAHAPLIKSLAVLAQTTVHAT